jgi:hypothetical protein
MGDIADMMLEGILCEGCGELFDDMDEGHEPPGHPRRCDSCEVKIVNRRQRDVSRRRFSSRRR